MKCHWNWYTWIFLPLCTYWICMTTVNRKLQSVRSRRTMKQTMLLNTTNPYSTIIYTMKKARSILLCNILSREKERIYAALFLYCGEWGAKRCRRLFIYFLIMFQIFAQPKSALFSPFFFRRCSFKENLKLHQQHLCKLSVHFNVAFCQQSFFNLIFDVFMSLRFLPSLPMKKKII